MKTELKGIEGADCGGGPIYLRFSNHSVARTESYAGGEVNVDVDDRNQVIGIEMLSIDAEEIAALADVTRVYDLSLLPLFSARKVS
ncbi:MAG TPA: DUF2283 domain-containing protein [Candidatus Baltobacteraceae bacterium]|nr:DUF2283 domain-containing protein [Candidatus Baltobacteraceae bacterium]